MFFPSEAKLQILNSDIDELINNLNDFRLPREFSKRSQAMDAIAEHLDEKHARRIQDESAEP